MRRTLLETVAPFMLATILITPAMAQAGPAADIRKTDASDNATEERVAANRRQADLAGEIADAALASRKAHDDAVSAAKLKSGQDEAAYMAALSAHRKAVAKYNSDKAEWESIVAACARKDRKLCPPEKHAKPLRTR